MLWVDRNREGIDTGLGKGFAGIGRREAELVERNRLVLHDESPVTTETRFMGLTPKGPRPLPSPSPLILGVPKARHSSAQRGSSVEHPSEIQSLMPLS